MMKLVLGFIENSNKGKVTDELRAKIASVQDDSNSIQRQQRILKSSVFRESSADIVMEEDGIQTQSASVRALCIPEILELILTHLVNSSPVTLNPNVPIDFAKADSTKFNMTPPKLLNANLVNKLWNRVATPLMYKNSRLGSARACDLLARTLRETSTLGHDYGAMMEAFVVILPFSNNDTDRWNVDEVVHTIAHKCPNLERLNLADCKQITDKSIIAIAQNCKKLTSLDLNRCAKVTSAAIEELANAALPLQSLHLCRPLVDTQEVLNDASIARLIAVSPDLRVLRLRSCNRITDLTISQIASTCPELMALDLSWCGRISDNSMAVLGESCKKLRSIALNGCRLLTDRSLRSLLSNASNLQSISLAHLPFATNSVLTEMAPALHNLNILSLNGCAEVTDISIVAIATACKRLESLSLFSINIGDESMSAITSNCAKLQSFSISGCERVSDTGASLIRNLSNLTSLYLNTRSITDSSIVAISNGCHFIRALSLNDCIHVTSTGILSLTSANANLISLSIDKTQITMDALRALTLSKRLREISAKECEKLTDELSLKEIVNNGRISIIVSNAAALARLTELRMETEAANAVQAVNAHE